MLAETIQSKAKAESTDRAVSLPIAIFPSIRILCENAEPMTPTRLHPTNWKNVQGPCPRKSMFVLRATHPEKAIAHGAP